ncbi:MAG TPA: CPBP family glutamic-type intramembrane protease [Candidatus Dormibacteraeota bacterium]
MKEWVKARPIVAFFVLSYIGTWIIWVPVLLSKQGLGLASFDIPIPPPLFLIVSTITGPTLAAFLVERVVGGRDGVRALRHRVLHFRVNLGWYLLVIFGPLVILLVASLWTGVSPVTTLAQHWELIFTSFLPATALGLIVTIFEEIGWMGAALPRLQAARGPLIACIILGPLWAAWHLPSFFVAGSGGASTTGINLPLIGLQLLVLSLLAIAFRVVATWIFNATAMAVPLIMLLHSAFDQAPALFGELKIREFSGNALDFTNYAAWAVCAVIVAILTRGRLKVA